MPGKRFLAFLLISAIVIPELVFATDFSSTNFTVKDPVIDSLGGFGNTPSYQVWGDIPYISPTAGTSNNFQSNPGSQGFWGGVGNMALTATPGVASVSLSWNAVQAIANVTYEVGVANGTGGPYTYDSAQAATSATKSNLSFATTYFFIIRVKDGLGAVIGYSNEVSAVPLPTQSSGGGGGGGGGGSSGTPVEGTPATTPVVPTNPVVAIVDRIIDAITPSFLKPKPTEPIIVPLEQLVPKVAPLALRTTWSLIDPRPVNELALRPLPRDIANLAGKIPQLGTLFNQVGITKFNDLSKLRNVSLNVPGLTNALGLPMVKLDGGKIVAPRSILLAELSPDLKSKFPTDVLFTKVADGKIDVKASLTVSLDGRSQSEVRLISGKRTSFVMKPEGHPVAVKGYLVFKSRPEPRLKNLPLSSTLISVAHAATTDEDVRAKKTSNEETALVIAEFEFTDPDNDGIYTADIVAPQVAGNYEVVTVIQYQDERDVPRAIRLLAVIDPEGYIYESNKGRETRILGSIVTLQWLNPETKQYELWPAADYSQENPQVTDVTGEYSFLVPAGYYQIRASAPGYLDYEGSPFEVRDGAGVHQNIELKQRFWFLKAISWEMVALFLVMILLVYNFYKDRRRDKIESKILEQIDKQQ